MMQAMSGSGLEQHDGAGREVVETLLHDPGRGIACLDTDLGVLSAASARGVAHGRSPQSIRSE